MQVHRENHDLGDAARAAANGPRVEDLKHYKAARLSRRAPKAPPQEERSFASKPPRVGGGPSEVIILDAAGSIVVVNQAWREAIASSGIILRNAGVGAGYTDVVCRFLPDADRTAIEQGIARLLSGGVNEIRHVYALRTSQGLRWRRVQISPLAVGATGRFVALHDDLTEVALTQEALQASSEQILSARDDERQRIAIELHDSTSQHLAAMSMGLAKLRRASPLKLASAIIDDIATSLREAAKETRVLSYLMKPRGMAQSGLTATVRQFLDGLAQRTGLEVALETSAGVDRLPPSLQHAALRIIQEALLNANRHARASKVSVEIAVCDHSLTLTVSDNGCGMPADQGEPCLGVGIPGMRARAEQVAGHLAIASDATGTRVVATLPLT